MSNPEPQPQPQPQPQGQANYTPFTVAERLKQLEGIDKTTSSLLSTAAQALTYLAPPTAVPAPAYIPSSFPDPSGGPTFPGSDVPSPAGLSSGLGGVSHPPAPSSSTDRETAFAASIDTFLTDLHTIDVHLKRHLWALAESNIITLPKSEWEITADASESAKEAKRLTEQQQQQQQQQASSAGAGPGGVGPGVGGIGSIGSLDTTTGTSFNTDPNISFATTGTTTTASGATVTKAARAKKSRPPLGPDGKGAIGKLDVGLLNSQAGTVEEELDREIWHAARVDLEKIVGAAEAKAAARADTATVGGTDVVGLGGPGVPGMGTGGPAGGDSGMNMSL